MGKTFRRQNRSSRNRPCSTSAIRFGVGCRNQPDVDLDRLARARRLDLAILDGAQELDLGGWRQFADFVEEEGAAGRLDELARVLLGGAGEGAILVAEQQGFEEVIGDRPAIDRDERLGPPVPGAMDRPRDQFLPDSRLAFDQDRNRRGGGPLGLAQHCLHARAARHDVLERQRSGMAALEALDFRFQCADGERVAQRDLQALGADRLHHEIGRARAHGRNHIVDAAVVGLHDDRNGDAGLAHARQHAQAVEIGHDQIEHHAIDAGLAAVAERLDRGLAAIRHDGVMTEAPRHGLEQPTLHRIVIDDENGGHGGSPADVPM
jgi:hypothetical protein